MTIVHVTETAISGVATFLRIMAHVRPTGAKHVFLVAEGQAENVGAVAGLERFPGRDRGPALTLAMVRAAVQAARCHRPELMVFHSSFALAALVAVRLAGYRGRALYIPHSWSIAMFEDKRSLKARLVRLVEGNLARLADAVVNVSAYERAMVRDLGYGGRQEMVENPALPPAPGTPADRFASEPAALHLLFVGRFDRQKGYDILLEGFARARRQRGDLRLHLIGGQVRTCATDTHVPEGADVIGWVDKAEIDGWYRSADAVVVPSRWEGLPIVIPEALANGTPVLCSRRSGMEALIEPGASGEVFELDPQSLADCLLRLDKQDLVRRRDEALARYRERFSLERWQADFEAVIASVMAGRAG